MKKFLLPVLALLLLGSGLFADDAKVMPKRVGRFYLAPSFVFGEKSFDKDGERVDGNAVKIFNLGAALEYGITSWITAAIQWAPGINIYSDIDAALPNPAASARMFDVGDLFVGAKMQIIGTEAPVKTGVVRLAFAPGVKIPLPGPDYEEEAKNLAEGGTVTVQNLDHHVFGAGLRTYFDYIVNDNFFINFYNEFIFYPIKGDPEKAGLTEYILAQGLTALPGVEAEVNYGYDLTFELEPIFSYNLTEGIQFSAGLPVNYKTTPGTKVELSGPDALVTMAKLGAVAQGIDLDGEQTHLLTVKPNVSFFFTGWALPMEFKLGYFAPVWGQNESANHTISLQIKAYFQI